MHIALFIKCNLRSSAVAILLFSMIVVGCSSKNEPMKSIKRTSSGDSILIGGSKCELDLGIVDKRSDNDFRFYLENQTSEEIQITSIKTTCGCVKVNEFPKHLKSGERANIVLVVDSRRPPGRFEQSLNVICNNRSGVEIETNVPIRGYVRGVVVKQSYIRMGIVPNGHQITISGEIVGHSGPVDISVLPSESFGVVSKQIDDDGVSPSRTFCVILIFNSAEVVKSVEEKIGFKISTQTDVYDISVPVTGQVTGAIKISPPAVVFNLASTSIANDNISITLSEMGSSRDMSLLDVKYDHELFTVSQKERLSQKVCYNILVNRASALKPSTSIIDILYGDQIIGRVPVVVVP